MTTPIACLTSDWHLSHTAPVARSAETDWYSVQLRYVNQVKEIAGDLPIICAGDLFDKCGAGNKLIPNELINWSIEHLPHLFGIPGQHDLYGHNYDDIHKSAYWTLVQAGKITDLKPNMAKPIPVKSKGLWAYGCPWGAKVKTPEPTPHFTGIKLAVIHAYIWTSKHKHPAATNDTNKSRWAERLRGYDAAVFGDNHDGWVSDIGTPVINTGTLMRRKQDERHYQPHVGLLYDDGHIERVPLDCSEDKFIDVTLLREAFESEGRIEELLEYLRGVSSEEITFEDAVRRAMDGVSPVAAQLIEGVLNV